MVCPGASRAWRLFAITCVVSLSGCADRSVASAPSPSLPTWRLWLGIAVAVQLMLYFRKIVADASREQVPVGATLFGAALGAVIALALSAALAYTKLGEWGYRLTSWILDWGAIGIVVTIVAMALSSVAGNYSWMTVYVSFAWIYHDERLCKFVVLPGAIAGIVTGILPLVRVEIGYAKRQREKLRQQAERPPKLDGPSAS